MLESVNHPVHFVKEGKKLSPSTFIPFCDFGGNMSSMGFKIDLFEVPVCNSFQDKVLNDQLCYEVDLNKYSDEYNIDKQLKLGFAFLMDYNEDRQVVSQNNNDDIEKVRSMVESIVESDENHHALIYLETIGKKLNPSL